MSVLVERYAWQQRLTADGRRAWSRLLRGPEILEASMANKWDRAALVSPGTYVDMTLLAEESEYRAEVPDDPTYDPRKRRCTGPCARCDDE